MMILDRIEELLQEVSKLTASNAEEIEALRLKYLSKKGVINELMADFRNVPAEEKKTVGMKINELKQTTTERINSLKEQFAQTANIQTNIDLSRSPYPIALGTRHPLTIVKNEIIDIFSRMGFILADGPEVEDDLHVFTKMNFAADHPARDMQDTFFVSQHPNDVTKNILLRSHTSSVQARVMETTQPPIRIICPGRVYRNEAITARAHCFFHQVEGLYIDKNVSFTDLKQVLLSFAREMFGADTKIRLRPSMPYLWRQGMWFLQTHRMGRDSGMRHGRSQRPRTVWHRQQDIQRLRLWYGCGAYHQPQISGERPPYVL